MQFSCLLVSVVLLCFGGISWSAKIPYYQFGYEVTDAYSKDYHGHMEFNKGDKTLGEFKVKLPDGRVQVVSYEADDYGYRPSISYEYPAYKKITHAKDPHENEDLYLVPVGGASSQFVVLAMKKH